MATMLNKGMGSLHSEEVSLPANHPASLPACQTTNLPACLRATQLACLPASKPTS